MTNLIPISSGRLAGESVQTVNASGLLSELHRDLVQVRGATVAAVRAALSAPRPLTPEEREKKRRGGLARAAKERERAAMRAGRPS